MGSTTNNVNSVESTPATPKDDPIYGPLPLRSHLRETRVLYLQKGEWDDLITCRLEVVALGIKPEFDALSYVWGKSAKEHPISLNGHAVNVGSSLWSALRHLRSSEEDKALWADAICINQNSIQERNDQVALMRDIYSQCRGVLVWLGDAPSSVESESSHGSNHASPCVWMTDFANTRTPHPDDEHNITNFHTGITDYYRLPFALRHSLHIDHVMGAYCFINQLAQNKHINGAEIPLLANHDAFHKMIGALHGLMTRPWWARSWVIQEVVLPPTATIFYGKFVAPWDMFAHAARNYDHHRKVCCQSHYVNLHGNDIRHLELFSRTIIELDDLRQEWQGILRSDTTTTNHTETPRISLRQLLWKFRKRETSDARDRVYALFPLVNDWGKHVAMYPEYGWTAPAIYRAVAEKIITVDESLLVLVGTAEKSLPGLPSWVPDWAQAPARFELERLERTMLFDAAGGRRLEARFMGERVMELNGVMFDVVSAVSEPIKYDDEEETLVDFAEWYKLVFHSNAGKPGTSEYIAGGTRMEAYWRTLCIDTCRSLGQEEVEMGMAMGSRYRRCSTEYVRDCMALWMDHRGLPLGSSARQTPEMTLANGDLDASLNGKRGTAGVDGDAPPPEKRPRKNELTHSDKLNFVAIDFAITSATIQRRLFLTSNGYMGIGPRKMAVGDRVYVFAGGHVPFVVRAAGDGEVPYVGKRACHELIGDCYVHGVMDGEVMMDPEATRENVYLI